MDKEKKKKTIVLYLLILSAVIGLIGVSIFVISSTPGIEPVDNPVVIVENKKEPEKTEPVKIVPKAHKNIKIPVARRTVRFKSNDEIKQAYGMIETVYLFNGKSYTGAVVTINEEKYKIVTVDGEMNIQMKEIKMREIIH